MPSKRGTEQAMIWLKSKMAERDTLDSINAEICYNVITDLQKKRKVIGALYHQVYSQRKAAGESMDEKTLRALSKNLSIFHEHAPMVPPNYEPKDAADEWYQYLSAWNEKFAENNEIYEN